MNRPASFTPAGPVRSVWRRFSISTRVIAVLCGVFVVATLPQFLAQITLQTVNHVPVKLYYPVVFLTWFGQDDPAAYYGVPGAGMWHWVLTTVYCFLILLAVLLPAAAVMRYRERPEMRRGLATKDEAVKRLSEKQLVSRAQRLRPLSYAAGLQLDPQDLGFRVCEYRGFTLYTSCEDVIIIVGPARSGKGYYFILNWILAAPGAVVTTSVRPDNLKATLREKLRRGHDCRVFAPGVSGGRDFGHELHWDPVAGCEDEETLVRRMAALIPEDAFSGSTSNGGHWDTLGRQLASHLFHAAACGGKDVDTIWEWVSNTTRAREAVRIIRDSDVGLEAHAAHLEQVLNQPAEQLATSWAVLFTVLSWMDSRASREWLKPAEGKTVNLAEFILRKGCLFLLGDKKSAGTYIRIINGLLSEIDFISKGLAAASPGGRLDPPISYLLDEAGNFEYTGLYEGITAGGGSGRIIVAVFQSKSQLSQFGGQETAEALWDAASAKIILPGGGDPAALKEMSDLIGATWVERDSYTVNEGGESRSVQSTSERREILSPDEIRTLATGTCILFYRNLPPIIGRGFPFTQNPVYERCAADSKELDLLQQQISPYAQLIQRGRKDG